MLLTYQRRTSAGVRRSSGTSPRVGFSRRSSSDWYSSCACAVAGPAASRSSPGRSRRAAPVRRRDRSRCREQRPASTSESQRPASPLLGNVRAALTPTPGGVDVTRVVTGRTAACNRCEEAPAHRRLPYRRTSPAAHQRRDPEPAPRAHAEPLLDRKRNDWVRQRPRQHTCAIENSDDPTRIVPQRPAPLQERDAPLGDEPPNVPFGDAETLRKTHHIEQPRQFVLFDRARSPHTATNRAQTFHATSIASISRPSHTTAPCSHPTRA